MKRLLKGIPIHELAKQMGMSVLMITKHQSHLTPLMMANNNIMNLVQISTGLVMPLISQNSELTDGFENRLKDQRNKST